MTPRSSDCLHDSFRDWNTVSAHRNVELVRRFARVPRRPDVRVSPADLNYDVPPDADLRQLASAQGIDVEAPWFRLPEQRQLRCGFFPLVTRLHSGALLAVWREASAHAYCSFGRTVAARSLDGGRSWSVPWVVDFRRPGAWDTGGPENLVQTNDGSLWLGAWARIPEPEPGTVGKQRPEMYVLRSHDEGRSWEQLPKLGDGFQFLCSPMLELSNGEFLWLGSVPDPTDEGVTSYTSLRRAVFILRQPGEPLTPGADLVELGGLRFERYGAMQLGGTNECHVTETTTPGHLVMLTRSAVSEHYEQSTSTDYGRTWSPPRRSDLWHTPIASQPLLITLGDGTLVAVHDERGNGRSLAVPSFDGGTTWDFAHHQVVLDDPEFFLKDFSYPEVVDVGAGRLLVVFYNASHPEAETNGIFATFLDRSLFRTTFGGVRLADVGSVRRSDTVAWWRFDEGTGDTAHDDTGRHYGVLHGPAWSDGRYGRALAFDGLDDHLRVTNCPSLWLGQELTIEAWIRAPHPEREQTIVSRLPHYWFGLNRRRVCLRRGGEDGIAEASCHGYDGAGSRPLAARCRGGAGDRRLDAAGAVLRRRRSRRGDGPGAAAGGDPGAGAQRLASHSRPHLAGVLHRAPRRAYPLGRAGTPVYRQPARPHGTLLRPDRRVGAAPRRLESAPARGQCDPIPAPGRRDPVGGDPAPIRWLLGPLHGV